MSKVLAIVGASGHGAVVAEAAELQGWSIIFFDDAYPVKTKNYHWQILGNMDDLISQQDKFPNVFIAIGNNATRERVYYKLKRNHFSFPVIIHPASIVSNYAQIAEASIILAGAVVNPFSKIDIGCIINTSATVDHDCHLHAFSHISPGANLAGAVTIGKKTWVGIGAAIRQQIVITDEVIIGAGAVVVSNILQSGTAVGVPAKLIPY